MQAFTKVIYGVIDVELLSALHIGDGSDVTKSAQGSRSAQSSIVMDGEGYYVLPATSIAGVSLHYIKTSHESSIRSDALRLMGNGPSWSGTDALQESQVYYYDARCNNVELEWRTGVQMNHARGTAKEGRLYKNAYISPGMTASIWLQVFANDKDEEAANWIVEQIAQGYHTGRIAMGMRTSSGAGRFRVVSAHTMTLDLTQPDALSHYLDGVDACMELTRQQGNPVRIVPDEQDCQNAMDTYVLTAFCPEGLLVKSGDPQDRANAVNMSYTRSGEAQDQYHYYIPGTAVKGVLRTYAERVYSVLNLDARELDYLFGTDSNKADHRRRKSCIYTFDTDLEDAVPKVHNRIKVDRFLGSVIDGAKMIEETLCVSHDHPFEMRVMVDYSLLENMRTVDGGPIPDPEMLRKHARAIVYLAMRDLGTGRVTLGSGSGIGHGRLQGVTLHINGVPLPIDQDRIDCRNIQAAIQEALDSLQGGAR